MTEQIKRKIEEILEAFLYNKDIDEFMCTKRILSLITEVVEQERRKAVEGFSEWLVNIARTQMAKPFISADQLELGTEDYIIRYLSETERQEK